MSQGKRRGWREICQEVVTETHPERMNALLEELLRVLEELPHGEATFGPGGGREPLGNSTPSNGTPSRQNRP
jgi:hypothetical protein